VLKKIRVTTAVYCRFLPLTEKTNCKSTYVDQLNNSTAHLGVMNRVKLPLLGILSRLHNFLRLGSATAAHPRLSRRPEIARNLGKCVHVRSRRRGLPALPTRAGLRLSYPLGGPGMHLSDFASLHEEPRVRRLNKFIRVHAGTLDDDTQSVAV